MPRLDLLAAPRRLAAAALLCLVATASACGDDGGSPDDPNPAPTVTSASPATVAAGSAGFELTVTGTGFVPTSTVSWNGVARATRYLSATQVETDILAAEIAQPGTGLVTVTNPAPGGGTSAILQVAIGNPLPVLTSVAPSTVVAGSNGFTLVVTGSGFVGQSVVQWNGAARPTTFVNASQLTATIAASDVATTGTAQVSVTSPAPLGGTSASLPVTIGGPAPAITTVNPSRVTVGSSAATITVNGANFLANSVVHVNGSARTTTVVSAGQLTATLTAADLATTGTLQVTVVTPAPGGGTSNVVEIEVANPVPTLTSLSPATAVSGGAAFTLTVNGTGFVQGSTVRWNGIARTTQFVSATRLTASIPASDITSAGSADITVASPTPGGGTSNALPFAIGLAGLLTVQLPTKDLVWDATRQRIYASVPSTASTNANSVVAIDPTTGEITGSVFVGSEPGRLAIAGDASVLYVTLDGASAVRRIDLATFTAGLQFAVWSNSLLYAEDIEVMPGAPGTVAISLMNPGSSPRLAALAIYDDGVRRPTLGPGHTGSNRIEFGANATTLYGYNNETTEFGFRLNTITASGVTETWVDQTLISGFGVDIEYDGGRIFATNGAVVDPVGRTRLGTVAGNGIVEPEVAKGRVYFASENTISAFSTTSFTSTGSLTVPGVAAARGSLIRWGTDGLAYRAGGEQFPLLTASATQVVIVRTSLVP